MDRTLETFEGLYDRNADGLFRHFFYRLGERERAKELTQEVFMRLWQHLAAGKSIEHERAFLYRIAHNLFVNEIRTDRRTHSLDEMLDETGFDPSDETADSSRLAEYAELRRYLSELKESHRTVLVMRYIDGLSVGEIADTLGEAETTISMRIARALQRLRNVYDKQQTP